MAQSCGQGPAVKPAPNDSAPLIATPAAPVPEGGVAEWCSGSDGARLRAALFPAKGETRGSVVLSPGRTEALEKYFEVIGELQSRGFVVLIHDWRGQGLSARGLDDRMKGHAVGWQPFLDDYRALLDLYADRLPRPWVQMAHSMGGCLALLALVRGEKRFVVSALSSPMLGIVPAGYPRVLSTLLSAVGKVLGLSGRYLFEKKHSPFELTFEKDRITHDRARWDRAQAQIHACPDLALGHVTWGWVDFALTATAFLRNTPMIAKLEIPVLIVASSNDDRVQIADTRVVAAKLPHCTLIEVPASYHEVLQETDDVRAIWWEAFDGLVAGMRA